MQPANPGHDAAIAVDGLERRRRRHDIVAEAPHRGVAVADRPPASIVIAALDEERYVGEAIESALAQTWEPVEVVVVDDGSTDRTAEIAASYEGVRVVSQGNRGLSAARNAGVAASTGEILAFLDADDVLMPEKLEVQIGRLLADEEPGCVLASQELFAEGGTEVPPWALGRDAPHFKGLGDAGSHTPNLYPVTMVLPRRLFDEVGGFDETMAHSEDVDMVFRLMERGVKIARLPDKVVRRRIHADAMTQDTEASRAAIFDLFKRRIDRRRG